MGRARRVILVASLDGWKGGAWSKEQGRQGIVHFILCV